MQKTIKFQFPIFNLQKEISNLEFGECDLFGFCCLFIIIFSGVLNRKTKEPPRFHGGSFERERYIT